MSVVVSENSKVTLHFSIELENGDLIESTFGYKPGTFEMGDGSLLPGFERHLVGLNVGEKRSFTIPQQDAFGAHNPQNVQFFKASDFADTELSEGLIVSFADASGAELPGVIKSVSGDDIEVDFNHPLAGKTLIFTAEIVGVD